jgi:hypothetical protein
MDRFSPFFESCPEENFGTGSNQDFAALSPAFVFASYLIALFPVQSMRLYIIARYFLRIQ